MLDSGLILGFYVEQFKNKKFLFDFLSYLLRMRSICKGISQSS